MAIPAHRIEATYDDITLRLGTEMLSKFGYIMTVVGIAPADVPAATAITVRATVHGQVEDKTIPIYYLTDAIAKGQYRIEGRI